MSAAVNMDEVYVLDAWDDSRSVATVEVYGTREKARAAMERYLDRHPGFEIYAGVFKRKIR